VDDRERASYRPSRIPVSESDAPPSAGQYDQEFLYHLYRGSELLQENSVDEAKAELERALKLQPKDIEGQGLLGVVYFRLGLYPRAIEIYEALTRVAPAEIAPRINLGLCYLKTGQTELAHKALQSVIERDPHHERAWGYLGLVYQRFGDFAKAQIAFERAGRPKLAERMAALQDDESTKADIPELGSHNSPSNHPVSFRPSLMPRVPAPPAVPEQIGGTMPPAPQVVNINSVGVPVHVGAFARQTELVFPENPRIVLHESGCALVRIERSIRVRRAWITAISHDRAPLMTINLDRHGGSIANKPPLGGDDSPLVSLRGNGRATLTPKPGTRLFVLELDSEPLHLLERVVIAFEAAVGYELSALDPVREDAPSVLRLSGAGAAVGYSTRAIRSIEVRKDRPLYCRAEDVIGWVGRLTPRLVSPLEAPAGVDGLVSFHGDGRALVEIGLEPTPVRSDLP
jgi:hypothetical protein